MKKVYNFLKLFMWGNIGTFCGRAISEYMFYKKYPKIYEMQSAPWYTELIFLFTCTVVITVILIIARVILKKKIKEQEDNEKSQA